MKKIVASVGLVALGASSLQAAVLPGLTEEAGKPWSVSATLRGFYDDNFNTAPDDDAGYGDYERDSFGFEVSPSVLFAFPIDQTTISAGYTGSYKYYENKLIGRGGHDDWSHTFNVSLDHAFSERYNLSVKDSFVIGQEPDLLRTGNAMTTFQRVPGDNIRNFGAIKFRGEATRQFGYELGYANSLFKYDDTGERTDVDGNVLPSLGGLLNRLEHVGNLDLRWKVQPQTVGLVGYQYREVNYTEDEIIADDPFTGLTAESEDRNSRTHYVYAGLDHTFTPTLSGAIRAGAEYTDYYNDDFTDGSWSPYALANVRYTYMPQSFVELGVTHDRNATDVIGIDADSVTLDQESTVAYVSLNHRITSKLFGTLLGQYQHSTFEGGPSDNDSEEFWMAGVNLEYRFNPYFSAHAGYNYDLLDSDTDFNRDMHRNRVYIGVTARY